MDRWDSLTAVAAEVQRCARCALSRTRTNAVPGEGSPAPTIMFIGEGPGFNEDQQGRPFVGRAGQLLDELLQAVPMRRSDVFITNVVKCRPPENREPLPEEVAACSPYLDVQIELLNPRVIATLGRYSLARFFPEARISAEHGRILRWRTRVVLPLYHPAAALRSTAIRAALEADFKRLPEAVIESIRISSGARGDSAPVAAAATNLPEPASSVSDGQGDERRGQLSLF